MGVRGQLARPWRAACPFVGMRHARFGLSDLGIRPMPQRRGSLDAQDASIRPAIVPAEPNDSADAQRPSPDIVRRQAAPRPTGRQAGRSGQRGGRAAAGGSGRARRAPCRHRAAGRDAAAVGGSSARGLSPIASAHAARFASASWLRLRESAESNSSRALRPSGDVGKHRELSFENREKVSAEIDARMPGNVRECVEPRPPSGSKRHGWGGEYLQIIMNSSASVGSS